MGQVPPRSIRFCVMCEKETKWIYNKNTGHSNCNLCGGNHGSDPESFFTTVFKQKIRLEKELRLIKKNYIKLMELCLQEEDIPKHLRKKIKYLYNPKKVKKEVKW